jgi:hypothetical protein
MTIDFEEGYCFVAVVVVVEACFCHNGHQSVLARHYALF